MVAPVSSGRQRDNVRPCFGGLIRRCGHVDTLGNASSLNPILKARNKLPLRIGLHHDGLQATIRLERQGRRRHFQGNRTISRCRVA